MSERPDHLVPSGPARSAQVLPPPDGFTIRPAVLWGALAVLVLLVGVVPGVRNQIRDSVFRAPEPITALAFADPAAPLDCARGTAGVTVTNRSGRDHTYAYTVTATGRAGQSLAPPRRARLSVPAGQAATVRVRTGVPLPVGTHVDVELAGGPQRIRASCSGPAR